MTDSITNHKAIAAWKRQPDIDALAAERDTLQKQLDKVLAGPFSTKAKAEADTLLSDISKLNKTIGSKTSRPKKGKAE
jgi:hypothetical protein